MRMQRVGILSCLALLLAAFVLSSCSSKSPTESTDPLSQGDTTGQNDTTTTPPDTADQAGDTTSNDAGTEIDWVSTNILYHPELQQHDHSLLFVMASWCPHCQRLKANTLTDSTVIAIINRSFNAAYVHIDSFNVVSYFDTLVTEQEFGNDKYGVHSYPTIFVLDPNANITHTWVGERDAEQFASELNGYLSTHE